MIKPLKETNGDLIRDHDGFVIYEESDLTPPPGMGTGALLTDLSPHLVADGIWRDEYPTEVIDPDDWPDLINEGHGDQRKDVHWIYSQKSIGSCAAEGWCGCNDTTRSRRGAEIIQFNPYVNYYFACNGVDRGSGLGENIRVSRQRGLVPMELWPRTGPNAHAWNDVPPDSSGIWREAAKYKPGEVYSIGNTVELASAIFAGHAVYAAYPGHAWQMIAVLSKTQGILRNSWSDTWDGDGYGVISFARVTYQYGLYALRTTSVG